MAKELLGFPIYKLPRKPGTVWLLRFDKPVTPIDEQHCREAWYEQWERKGQPAPPILVIDKGAELTALSDNELRAAGLMRIPTQ